MPPENGEDIVLGEKYYKPIFDLLNNNEQLCQLVCEKLEQGLLQVES